MSWLFWVTMIGGVLMGSAFFALFRFALHLLDRNQEQAYRWFIRAAWFGLLGILALWPLAAIRGGSPSDLSSADAQRVFDWMTGMVALIVLGALLCVAFEKEDSPGYRRWHQLLGGIFLLGSGWPIYQSWIILHG